MQNIDDFKVDYKGTTYSLLTLPPEDSAVVQEYTGQILRNVKLVESLKNSDELLRRAYISVTQYGGLRVAVLDLQADLMHACTETLLGLADFEKGSHDVLANMTGMVRYLVQPGKTDLALKYGERCSAAAHTLMDRAAALAQQFQDLRVKSIPVAPATEKQDGLEALDDAALFWVQMQKFCGSLNSNGFQADVELLKDDPSEMINVLRTDDEIKKHVVICYAGWLSPPWCNSARARSKKRARPSLLILKKILAVEPRWR